jgi:hypothetical protein
VRCGAKSGTFSSLFVFLLQSRFRHLDVILGSEGAVMRLGQFRASQGHLSCVPTVVIAVVLQIPAAAAQGQQAAANASACAESHILSKRVTFADLLRAQKTLGHKDHYAKQLSDFDMGARQKTTAPTNLKEFLDVAAGAGRSWTALEKKIGRPWLAN